MMWGKLKFFASHGFGGPDRGRHHPERPSPRGADRRRLGAQHAQSTPDHRLHGGGAWRRRCRRAIWTSRGARRGSISFPRSANPEGAGVIMAVEGIEAVDDHRLRVRFSDQRAQGPPPCGTRKVSSCIASRFRWTEAVRGVVDTRDVRFGFRWFGVDGVGLDALLRLNGRRVRLYSAISWGYWGFNGLWPMPSARREVMSAHKLGLNALHFHRNVGKPEVFDAMDEMGLLRVMEPGGGRHAIGRDLKPGETLSEADEFSRAFPGREVQVHGPRIPLAAIPGAIHLAERDRREPLQS
ncbi:hypothetical protein ACRAWD_15265 [Caulobacter segnis]